MSWIEFHTALHDHWKIDRLRIKLDIPYAYALGLIGCLWTWAAEFSQKGDLNRFTDDEIIAKMRYEGEKKGMKKILLECELIDEDGFLHDWGKHGLRLLKSSRKRQKKYRENDKNDDATVTSRSHNKTISLRPSYPTIPYPTIPYPTNNNPPTPQGEERVLIDFGKNKTVELPDDLKPIADEIVEWLRYKQEKGHGYKSIGLKNLWDWIRNIPTEKRSQAIKHSMAQNWTGIFEQKSGGNHNAGTPKTHTPEGNPGTGIGTKAPSVRG